MEVVVMAEESSGNGDMVVTAAVVTVIAEVTGTMRAQRQRK
jgi:hypothetical protein